MEKFIFVTLFETDVFNHRKASGQSSHSRDEKGGR